LIGDNTDAPGFLLTLKELFPEEPQTKTFDKHAVILGSGGGARAVAYALAGIEWQVTVAARRIEQARQLSWAINPQKITPTTIRAFFQQPPPIVHLIVNATPVGMFPNHSDSLWPAEIPLPAQAAVYDLVYNPPQTKLLRQAARVGLKTINGLGMLIEQAALALERWTGQLAPRQPMYAAVQIWPKPVVED